MIVSVIWPTIACHTVKLILFNNCVCVRVCKVSSEYVSVHRYACVKEDMSFSKHRNVFLWTEHYLNGNTL